MKAAARTIEQEKGSGIKQSKEKKIFKLFHERYDFYFQGLGVEEIFYN